MKQLSREAVHTFIRWGLRSRGHSEAAVANITQTDEEVFVSGIVHAALVDTMTKSKQRESHAFILEVAPSMDEVGDVTGPTIIVKTSIGTFHVEVRKVGDGTRT